MDGVISKSQVNGRVIVYNGNSHDWMEAEFTENIIDRELRKGLTYPVAVRQKNSKEYKYMFDTSFEAEISSQVFYDEILQEKLFCLLYVQNSDGADNFFEFEFPEEANIENKQQQDQDIGKSDQRSRGKVANEFERAPEEQFTPNKADEKKKDANIFHSDMRKTDS